MAMEYDLYNEDDSNPEHVASIEVDNITRIDGLYRPGSWGKTTKIQVSTFDDEVYECDYIIPNT